MRWTSYLIERLPRPQPIFTLIQDRGSLPDAAMFAAFNMGVGFCLICEDSAASTILRDLEATGYQALQLSRVVDGPGKTVSIAPFNLVGAGAVFTQRR